MDPRDIISSVDSDVELVILDVILDVFLNVILNVILDIPATVNVQEMMVLCRCVLLVALPLTIVMEGTVCVFRLHHCLHFFKFSNTTEY